MVFDGEAISAKIAPAPISGGTLIVSKKAPLAFASNPDANIVDVINLDTKKVTALDMGEGSEPGRLVEDDAGMVHVVLRRAGAIATIDPATGSIDKRDVCPAPRGIVSQEGRLVVACQGGELVSLAPTGVTTTMVDGDLRDVLPGSNPRASPERCVRNTPSVAYGSSSFTTTTSSFLRRRRTSHAIEG